LYLVSSRRLIHSISFHSTPHPLTFLTDQVVRSNGVNIDVGKLLFKTKDTTSASARDSPTSSVMARWMVSIEGSLSEEDISEGMLGRVLVTTADGGSASAENISIISDGSHSTISASNITTTTYNHNDGPTTTAPNTNTKKAVSTAVKVPQDRKHHSSTSAATRRNNQVTTNPKRTTRTRSSAADPSELFGGIEDVVLPPTKRIRKRNGHGTTASTRLQAGETSVSKVPMLTGTLYLFRGRTRRAEFIRHK
jgi:hypothetical protein